MIRLLRVDHRLLHGQVALSWTNELSADCILIANDDIVKDELKMTTTKLAKPASVKLVIKNIEDSIEAINSGKTDKYKLFIVVGSIRDAARLCEKCSEIKTINLGGTKQLDNLKRLSKTIYVSEKDITDLKQMTAAGLEVEIRQVPAETKLMVKDII